MVLSIRPDSWSTCRRLVDRLQGRVYRGQSDEAWPLSSTLERTVLACGFKLVWAHKVERFILEHFSRRAGDFMDSAPAVDEYLDWLSILQHHGGPTRLLDFTHSFYIGAFFALEYATNDAAVWAVSVGPMREVAREWAEQGYEHNYQRTHRDCVQKSLLRQGVRKAVVDVEPFRLRERQASQQSVFLVPLDISETFESILRATYARNRAPIEQEITLSEGEDLPDQLAEYPIIKIILAKVVQGEILADLWSMNISTASLFPGLDGFARSMRYFVQRAGLEYQVVWDSR